MEAADKLLKYHNLKKLWLELKPLIQPLCGSNEGLYLQKEVEEIILAFHKYDPTGQESRYTRTIKGV